jgi:ribonuclease BN (tRNA processing enzyme)
VSLVLHESTNAYLPPPYGKPKDTLPGVRERAESRGHSTPEMAGAFAQACNAQFLVLTHFSSRYYGSGPKARHWMSLFEDTAQLGSSASQKTVKAMFERDARLSQDNKSQRRVSERCQGGFNGQVLAAYDGMIVDIPPTGIMRPLVADEIPCHYTGDALYYHEFASEKCHLQKNLDKARKTP